MFRNSKANDTIPARSKAEISFKGSKYQHRYSLKFHNIFYVGNSVHGCSTTPCLYVHDIAAIDNIALQHVCTHGLVKRESSVQCHLTNNHGITHIQTSYTS